MIYVNEWKMIHTCVYFHGKLAHQMADDTRAVEKRDVYFNKYLIKTQTPALWNYFIMGGDSKLTITAKQALNKHGHYELTTLTHSPTLSLTLSLTHSLTHSLSLSLTHSLTLSLSLYLFLSVCLSLSVCLCLCLCLCLSLSHTHTHIL